jgi:catechol 2,3-dioxygenase-like lactoylglutathione lyase family enzyme
MREDAMARIKHIALVTDDPAKTAEFYKQHFGLTELYRRPTDTGEKGVWLSDGYIYFAILKYGTEDAPKLGPGQTSDLRGIHHIGFRSMIFRRQPRRWRRRACNPCRWTGRGRARPGPWGRPAKRST